MISFLRRRLSATPQPHAGGSPTRGSTWLLAYALLTPTLLGVAVFTLWPVLESAYWSLFRRNAAVRVPQFVGLGNYGELALDPLFWRVLANTVGFTLLTTPLCVAGALLLALLLNRRLRGIGWLRLAFFHPVILPMVSAGTIWLFLYTPDYGLVADLLRPFGLAHVRWLGNPDTALGALVVMTLWKQVGFYMIFYLAGLQHLPRELFESARLDGANNWQLLRFITVPLLRNTTLFVTLSAAVAAVQTADQIYIMTSGGPRNATNLLLFHIYETYFRFGNQGHAFAMTIVLVGVMFGLTTAYLSFSERGRDAS